MPSSRPEIRFSDILENIALIEAYVVGLDQALFTRDRRTRDAVERCLQRISEAALKLGTQAEQLAPGPPWSSVSEGSRQCPPARLRPGRPDTDMGDHRPRPSGAQNRRSGCCRAFEVLTNIMRGA